MRWHLYVLGAGLLTLLSLGLAGATVTWENATAEAGIAFQMAGSILPPEDTINWPAFPEIMSGGACWFDADGDGYEDVYLVNQRYNPENPGTDGWIDMVDPHNQLYLNDGDGTFTEVSRVSGTDSRAWGYGCSAADYDADGDIDLYVTNFGMNELFENTGNGTFENATAQAGVGGQGLCSFEHRCLSTSSAWADYDLDGDLDLYVANYVDTNLTDPRRGPIDHDGQVNFLFQNEGDGTFTEVAAEAGVQGNPTDLQGSKSLGVVWFDHDQDGDQDLYVANDQVPNDFYENNGDGTFTERSDAAGLADDRAGMGVTAGDYDRDGDEDLFFTHYSSQHNGFYRNLGDGTFEDRSGEDDLAQDWDLVAWGTRFEDHDRDGDLDLIVMNGHTSRVDQDDLQASLLFEHAATPGEPADPTWMNATATAGPAFLEKHTTRGAAFADYDLDGDTDILAMNQANASALLMRASGLTNHWLTLELSQPGPNPQAIGAGVAVTVDDETHWFQTRSGSSYLSKDTTRLTVGLGTADRAEEVQITWPDGGTSTFADVAAGQVLLVDRAQGELVADTFSPRTTLTLQGTPGTGAWWTTPVDVVLETTDRGVTETSGVATVQVAVGDDPLTSYEGEVLHLEEGVHPVTFTSEDHAGNKEPVTTQLVRVDHTPPSADHALSGTRGQGGWWVSQTVNVTLTGRDAVSGLARLEARVDQEGWAVVDGPIVLVGDGVHTVAYRAVDRAGNVGPVREVEVPIDHTAPTVRFLAPQAGEVHVSGYATVQGGGPVAVVLDTPLGPASTRIQGTGQDATSGLAELVLSIDGASLGTGTAPGTWTWSTGEAASGLHVLELAATDAAGNRASQTLPVLLVGGTPGSLAHTVTDGPALHTDGLLEGDEEQDPVAPSPGPRGSLLPGPTEACCHRGEKS